MAGPLTQAVDGGALLASRRADRSLAANAVWLACAKTLALAFGVAVPLLLVRRLSVGEFGLYRQLFLIVDTVVSFLPLGFAMSAFYFFPREPEKKDQVVLNILLFHLAVGGLAWTVITLRPALLAALFRTPEITGYAPLISAAVLLWVTSGFLELVAIANGEIRVAAAYVAVMHLTRSLLLLGAAAVFGSVRALVYAASIHGVLQVTVAACYLRSRFPNLWRWPEGRLLRAQLAYVLPLGYAGALWWLQMNVHHYFVSNRFGAAVYAIYAVGCFQIPLVGLLLESVGSVMIPRVSYLQTHGARRRIIALLARMMRTLGAVCFPFYFLLLVVGREFIAFLFTERYLESWPILAINLALIPLSIIATAYDAVFRAYPEHLPFLLRVRTILLGPLLAGLWIAPGRVGPVGAIVVVVVINALERLIIAAKVGQVLGLSWSDLALFKDAAKLLGSAGMAAVVAGIGRAIVGQTPGAEPLAVLVICGTIYTLAYLGSARLLGAFGPADRKVVREQLASMYHRGRAGGRR